LQTHLTTILKRTASQRFVPAVAALLGLLAWTLPAQAQTMSQLGGKVMDASGGVIAGARVLARNTGNSLERTALTGADGRYIIPSLPIGVYEVRAEFTGFRPMVKQGIRLVVGEAATVDLTLEVGPIEQAVVVEGSSPLVNTQSAELSYLVGEEPIETLPLNGRNYTDLALLQPGVVAFSHRDGGSVVAHGLGTSINGQDFRSNVYLLDGTPINDFTNGPAGSAAGTALGTETVKEFRVEANAYSAEFGRNSGGQINVVSKSGTNEWNGTLYHFFRNDNFDARNFFDGAEKPEFVRNQLGATVGGPLRKDRTFLYGGYETLRERLGRTIQTIVPDNNARMGILPAALGGPVVVNAAVQPYLNEFPVANGTVIPNSGLARHSFLFSQELDENFATVRVDHQFAANHEFFARYTYDGALLDLPTDFPQFPRAFLSRNQAFTAEYRNILSAATLQTFRLSFSRTRIGQDVQANVPSTLQPFVPGRLVGDIDIGGIPRFGPQTSVNVQLVQNLFGFEYGWVQTRGKHLLKSGVLIERYQDNMFNPTFSLGIYTFANIRSFLLNTPQRFLGLPPTGALDRYWRFTLFGFYLQDQYRLSPRLTLNAGLRYEFSTLPKDIYGRDSALVNLSDPAPTVGQLFQNPTHRNISPRIGLVWNVFGNGRTALRSGYGWYFNTNNHQNLIVTVTNPPATPRIIIANPTFPNPPFALGAGNSIRPVEWNIKNPNVHQWNLTAEQQFWGETLVSVGYAGTRGVHLLRNGDVNVPAPVTQPDGSLFFPAGQPRPNPAFTTIELKRSDGNSWYNALLVEVRKLWGKDFLFQSSYTFSRNIDTTQASTFFSDATNGTTSAFPEFPGLDYNKGLADYHAKHNWVMHFIWRMPFARDTQGAKRALLEGWQISGISNVRSGNPLTVFVQGNRSRSQWSPSQAPGIGFDRPNIRPGFTHESAVLGLPGQWFDPNAFELPERGRLGNLGRGALIGPNLRTFDFALVKETGVPALGDATTIQFRAEVFNLFNRTNLGTPILIAFAGAAATPNPAGSEAPLSTFGQVRSTVTSSRQVQLGLRLFF